MHTYIYFYSKYFFPTVASVPQDVGGDSVDRLPQFATKSQRLQVPEGGEVRLPCTTDRDCEFTKNHLFRICFLYE